MINKRYIHINLIADFNTKKISANPQNTQYTLGNSTEVVDGEPDIRYSSIVFIKDAKKIWTHGCLYNADSYTKAEINSLNHVTYETVMVTADYDLSDMENLTPIEQYFQLNISQLDGDSQLIK